MINKLLCFLGFHTSDEDYGMKFIGGEVFSNCIHCQKEIIHENLKWIGGGN